MDINFTGAVASQIAASLAQPWYSSILSAVIPAIAAFAGAFIQWYLTSKSEEKKLAREKAKEWTEKRKGAYYKFIEVYSTSIDAKKFRSGAANYLKAALEIAMYKNLVLEKPLVVADTSETVKNLEDLIDAIITFSTKIHDDESPDMHDLYLRFETLRCEAAKAFIPLIRDLLRLRSGKI
jgi:hypothetical protein